MVSMISFSLYFLEQQGTLQPCSEKLAELESNIGTVTDKWEEGADTTTSGVDYNHDSTNNTLTVSTAAGLAWMAKEVNAGHFAYTAVTLADDIDLSGKLWTPAKDFTGTFDGQGYTIRGLNINNEEMGTNLIYRFEKILHASVRVESRPGVGTRIQVLIPIKEEIL